MGLYNPVRKAPMITKHKIVSRETSSFEVITVDGAAAVGKTSVARRLSELLGYGFLSSGLGYRALSWAAFQRGWEWKEVPPLLKQVKLSFTAINEVCLDGEVVRANLYSEELSKASAVLSQQAWMRKKVNDALHAITAQLMSAGKKGLVAEGRDMGTEVFPRSAHKFFLYAHSAKRAERAEKRDRQLNSSRTELGAGSVHLDSVRTELRRRDAEDEQRDLSPLQADKEAVRLDTTELNLQQVVDKMYQQL